MLMATDGEPFPLNFINNALSVDTDLVMSVVIGP